MKQPTRIIGIVAALAGLTSGAAPCLAGRSHQHQPVMPKVPARLVAADDAATRRIDRYFAHYWAEKRLRPAPPADDAAFLRRVSLDLTGVIPTPEDVLAFLADRRPDKRARKIDQLLAAPRYADSWALHYEKTIVGTAAVLGQGTNRPALFRWLREAFATNMPYDRMAFELMAARGLNNRNGNANFIVLFEGKPAELASATARLFLGVNLQCAQCHNHPFQKWTQDDFWGMAAFYAHTSSKFYPKDPQPTAKAEPHPLRQTTLAGGESALFGPGDNGEIREAGDRKSGEVTVPSRKKPHQARMLYLDSGPAKDIGPDRRAALARWVTKPDNPFFARAIVNRTWAHFLSKGIIEPLDGLGTDEEAEHAALLDGLARDFVASGYDLKWLMRNIANARVYQMALGPNRGDSTTDYTAAALRPLDPDQWTESLLRATGVVEAWRKGSPHHDLDGRARNQLRQVRGEANRSSGPVSKALLQLNGAVLHEALSRGVRVREAAAKPTAGDRLDWIFLATLSRRPTEHERAELLPLVAEANDRQGVADLFWVLLNSTEFGVR